MATIRHRGPHQFQAIVRKRGYPERSQTFETEREARDWAAGVEVDMTRGAFVDRSPLKRTTFGDLLTKYLREVTPKKRGAETETSRIRQLQKHPLAARPLSTLSSTDFEEYCAERLEDCMPATVRRELVIVSAVFTKARMGWKIPLDNLLDGFDWPKEGYHRERRLEEDEEARLLAAAADNFSRAPHLEFCIRIALDTGMRAGEITGLKWAQIDLSRGIIRLDMTKNGDRRSVPLSNAARAAILALPRPIDGGKVVSFYDSRGLSVAFRRACKRAGIVGLRFHDLRHEAASRIAPHVAILTLAKMMGWRGYQMAMRYYNPTDQELVAQRRAVEAAHAA